MTFYASFRRAAFDDEGACTLTLNVPASDAHTVADLSRDGTGKLLKITVHYEDVGIATPRPAELPTPEQAGT